jgi:Na+-transporting NADH:ubiquinone oxidoreductase subunit C
MIVLVAVLLSSASLLLKPKQDFNVEVEKKQNILSAIGIKTEAKDAARIYDESIKESYCVNSRGEKIDGRVAFEVKLKDELAKPADQRAYPVFEAATGDGTHVYILPLQGKGLWGPLWGYVALKEDLNSIYGAVFDHKGETPGLGAEIANADFQSQFAGKMIFDENGQYVSVKVIKPGSAEASAHNVDGISGGTITSNGLGAMLVSGLENYLPFFERLKSK